MTSICRVLLASLVTLFLAADRADAQAFQTSDATYVAGTLPGVVPGQPLGPAIAYQNQGANDPIPDTLCIFGVCLVHNQGGFVVRCSASTRRCLVVQVGTGLWYLVQL